MFQNKLAPTLYKCVMYFTSFFDTIITLLHPKRYKKHDSAYINGIFSIIHAPHMPSHAGNILQKTCRYELTGDTNGIIPRNDRFDGVLKACLDRINQRRRCR